MGVSLLPVTDFYNDGRFSIISFDYKKLIIITCVVVYTRREIIHYFITDGHITLNNENNMTTTLPNHDSVWNETSLPWISFSS